MNGFSTFKTIREPVREFIKEALIANIENLPEEYEKLREKYSLNEAITLTTWRDQIKAKVC